MKRTARTQPLLRSGGETQHSGKRRDKRADDRKSADLYKNRDYEANKCLTDFEKSVCFRFGRGEAEKRETASVLNGIDFISVNPTPDPCKVCRIENTMESGDMITCRRARKVK